MKENNVVDPYIIVVGTPEHCEAAHLVVDCNIVSEVDISDIPVTLMAAFFVFIHLAVVTFTLLWRS